MLDHDLHATVHGHWVCLQSTSRCEGAPRPENQDLLSARGWRICVRSLLLPVTDQGRQAVDRFRIFV